MPKRVDATQREIVAALRKAGASVQSLANQGKGVPDLLVGIHGKNFLFEVKTEKGVLTPDQDKWFIAWRGWAQVVRTAEDALYVCGLLKEALR